MTTLQMTRRMPKGAPIRDRLEEYSIPDPNSGCWLWLGGMASKGADIGMGYGVLRIDGAQVRAHRAAYEEYIEPIPDEMHVLHYCDMRPCINPAHLFLGTNLDNIHDRMQKGRSAVGYNVGLKRLTRSDVLKITADLASGLFPQRELAKYYGVSQSTISKIARGVDWNWLTDLRKDS